MTTIPSLKRNSGVMHPTSSVPARIWRFFSPWSSGVGRYRLECAGFPPIGFCVWFHLPPVLFQPLVTGGGRGTLLKMRTELMTPVMGSMCIWGFCLASVAGVHSAFCLFPPTPGACSARLAYAPIGAPVPSHRSAAASLSPPNTCSPVVVGAYHKQLRWQVGQSAQVVRSWGGPLGPTGSDCDPAA